MTINGNVKFFDENRLDNNATYTLTSASTTLAYYLYDNNQSIQLTSSGSNDVSDEVWEIDFGSSKTFDRIFVDNHNIKAGKIEYWNGSSWVDFSSAISWSANTDTTNYYEFNSVSSQKIRLTMNTTQTADDEKRVGELRCFSELGTVVTNPSEFQPMFPEDAEAHRLRGGGTVHVSFGESFRTTMRFTDAESSDMTLFRALKNRNLPFYVYPGGGVTTNDQEGLRVQDMYYVNYVNSFAPQIKNNIYGIGTILDMALEGA